MENKFTHLNENGEPGMVNIGEKPISLRTASAQAIIFFGREIMEQMELSGWNNKKGNILQVAIVAGTMAAKKTSDLIPFCHPVGLNSCDFEFEKEHEQLKILCTCQVEAKTGVEMEAITGVGIAAITVYDMCKSISKGIGIKEIKLISKSGGKSDYQQK